MRRESSDESPEKGAGGAKDGGVAPAGGAAQGAPQPTGPRFVVEHRPVKLGRSDAGLRVIEQGLNPGEWVVVNGLQRARPGAEVQPERAKMAEPAAGAPVAFRVLPESKAVAEARDAKTE